MPPRANVVPGSEFTIGLPGTVPRAMKKERTEAQMNVIAAVFSRVYLAQTTPRRPLSSMYPLQRECWRIRLRRLPSCSIQPLSFTRYRSVSGRNSFAGYKNHYNLVFRAVRGAISSTPTNLDIGVQSSPSNFFRSLDARTAARRRVDARSKMRSTQLE